MSRTRLESALMQHPEATHELNDALWARQITFDIASQFVQQPLQFFHADQHGKTHSTQLMVEQLKEGIDAGPLRQFSIALLGPASPLLPQNTYRARHAELGDFAIFITAIARQADGIQYEACFSHER